MHETGKSIVKQLPKVAFAHLPTAVDYLPRLSEMLGGPKIYVKRDDQTGLAFGGNKTRKLEYLAADAQAANADMLITTGAVQSNHCRQTAAIAARLGMGCILVLAGEEPSVKSGNLLLTLLLGAQIIYTHPGRRDQALHEAFQAAREAGGKPYLIPYGGSNPVGAASYAYAIREYLEGWGHSFPDENMPDWIVVASSSGGTQAGLVTGAHLYDYNGKILGISIDNPAAEFKAHILKLARSTAEYLDVKSDIAEEDIFVDDAYLGEGYGVMGEPEKEAIKMFARVEGLLLDPVYTGRAAAGMIDMIRRRKFTRDDRILFWHTGGTPALFADRYREVISG